MDKQAWGVVTSVLAMVAGNAIPVGIVLVGGQSTETAMILYLVETLASILFTAMRLRLLAPAHDDAYALIPPSGLRISINDEIVFRAKRSRDRDALIVDYLLLSFAFTAGTGLFLLLFVFLINRANVSGSIVLAGSAGMLALQVYSLIADISLHGPLTAARCGALLQQSSSRVGLLFIAVLAGIFLALFAERWFVLPFAVLKTIIDLVIPIGRLKDRTRSSATQDG